MSIIRTPEDPEIRHQVAQADVEEAKAKMWRSLAALANVVYVTALGAFIVSAIMGAMYLIDAALV